MSFGFSVSGYLHKRLIDIKGSLETAAKGAFGDGVKTSPKSFVGLLIGVFSEALAEVWEQLQIAYWMLDPNSAEGVLLDNLAYIIGLTRLPATPSITSVIVNGSNGTLIPSGTQIAQAQTGEIFETIADVVIPALGATTVDVRSINKGAIEASSGSLTVKVTAVSGWDSVSNAEDALQGRAVESDSELRVRMRTSLQVAGFATVGAILSKILEGVDEVQSVQVYENATSLTDGSGRPPHSIEVVVLGGDDQEVADKLWTLKGAGIETTTTAPAPDQRAKTIVDSQGKPHTVVFSRATELDVWMIVEVSSSKTLSSGELEAIENDALAEGNLLQIADDVNTWRLTRSVNSTTVEDLDEVSQVVVKVGLTDPPSSSANLVVGETSQARFDSTRTTVVQV